MKSAASLRRSFGRISVTNEQRRELEASTVFHETDMGNFMDDCEAAGLATALLAQVKFSEMFSCCSCSLVAILVGLLYYEALDHRVLYYYYYT